MAKLQNEDFKTSAEIVSGGGTAAQLLNDTKIYVTANALNKTLNAAIQNGDIGGGGNKNYITALNGESGTSAFVVYANGAAIPTTGTGGSPTATLTTTSSSPLSGSNSLLYTPGALGNGFSANFTIDAQDSVNLLWFNVALSFTGTYASGDLTVWLYDVTNSVLIPALSSSDIQYSPSVSKQLFSFQAGTSTSYRLIVHQKTANSSYTAKIEGTLGPQTFAGYAPIATDPASYTPTFQGLGTVSGINFSYSRQGKYLRVTGSASCGTTTGSTIQIGLPSGLTIDSSITAIQSVIGIVTRSATNVAFYNALGLAGNSYINVSAFNPGGVNPFTPQAGNALFNNSDFFSVDFTVPISGWSSTSQIVSQYDGRAISCSVYDQSGPQYVANTPYAYDTIDSDPTGMWDSINNRIVIKVSGRYRISAGATAVALFNLFLRKNGSNKVLLTTISTSQYTLGGTTILDLIAGDYLEICSDSTKSVYVTAGQKWNYFDVDLISGAPQILAGQKTQIRYKNATASVSGSYSLLTYSTKDIDTGNLYSSGVFTCPVNSSYLISAGAYLSRTGVSGSTIALAIYKNGVLFSERLEVEVYTGVNATSISHMDFVECLAGDTLSIYVYDTDTSPVVSSSTTANFLSIKQI